MRFLPHTEEDLASMLKTVGAADLDDLFATVPEDCRREEQLNLPDPMTEWELTDELNRLARRMAVSPGHKAFLGAGMYEHHIPAVVTYLMGRSEFSTAYTPYQPEISQGTLQAIYEYQTLVTRILGMDVANASMYDGATALAEGLLMALRVTRRTRVAVSRSIHPHYRRVVSTYLGSTDYEIVELPFLPDGRTDLSGLDGIEDLAAVAVQSPNFFGCLERLDVASEQVHEVGGLLVATFSEPLAFGLFKNPGCQDADIVCGEGQSFGIAPSFGGPGLGMFATRKALVRSMPGRLVGKTVDHEGRRGFVLTLATREQHIRREKATSNICTNNSLCALNAAMYLACLGTDGIRELARLNFDKAEYLKTGLAAVGYKPAFSAPTFNEFVVKCPPGFEEKYDSLLERGLVPGLPLGRYYPELERHCLFCVTEVIGREDMDRLIEELAS